MARYTKKNMVGRLPLSLTRVQTVKWQTFKGAPRNNDVREHKSIVHEFITCKLRVDAGECSTSRPGQFTFRKN